MNSGERVRRKAFVDGDDERRRCDDRHRLEILVGVVVDLGGQRRQREQRDRAKQQRVAVGLGVRRIGRADDAAGADLVLHDEGLLESGLQLFGREPCKHVADAAGRVRHDQRDRAVRPGRIGGGGDQNACGDDGPRDDFFHDLHLSTTSRVWDRCEAMQASCQVYCPASCPDACQAGFTSFTAPFQPLSVTSNTMPSGVLYLTS